MHTLYLKTEAKSSGKKYRTLFNTPKQNHTRNLGFFQQSSLLTKIPNTLFPPSLSIVHTSLHFAHISHAESWCHKFKPRGIHVHICIKWYHSFYSAIAGAIIQTIARARCNWNGMIFSSISLHDHALSLYDWCNYIKNGKVVTPIKHNFLIIAKITSKKNQSFTISKIVLAKYTQLAKMDRCKQRQIWCHWTEFLIQWSYIIYLSS